MQSPNRRANFSVFFTKKKVIILIMLTIIAALAQNKVIGKQNALPWHLPADLKHFKALTMGKPIVMGRKTFDSIGKALPGRQNIIITRRGNVQAENCTIVGSLSEAIAAAGDATDIMIIGGASIYEQTLPMAERLCLTFVHHEFEGDTFFPEWEASEWHEVERVDCCADEKNAFDYSFVTLERA